MFLAIVVGGLVICSLVATTLGTAWLQAPPPTAPVGTASNDYERSLVDAIAANPNDSVALVSLANLLSTRGNHREAIDYYERAVALDPDNPAIRRAFALALAESGNEADAELQYERVLAGNPDDAEAYYFLGRLYAAWQPPRTAEAATAFEQAIAADPGSVSASQAELALAELRGQATPEPGG